MSRPAVSVVMPFAGDESQARSALAVLSSLSIRPGDELIIADNGEGESLSDSPSLASSLRELGGGPESSEIKVVRATAERSPAHARNVGAERAGNDWVLFLDADCRAPADLLDSYFSEPVGADAGALAGEVLASSDAHTLAARYGAARGFLRQEIHLAHPYRPRAVAANLMVRRAAFEQLGGFYEGVRAAEDTDFSWRLQQAGWQLVDRPGASVEHRYRTTVAELRRQWRGYAAGRAWLARRYEGFTPEPALRRIPARIRRRTGAGSSGDAGERSAARGSGRSRAPSPTAVGRLERSRYLALDALLAVEELRGFALSNRPSGAKAVGPAQVVLVAERFPVTGDPLAEFAGTLERARVEAQARPDSVAPELARNLSIAYREDDGTAARALALVALALRHPLRCVGDLFGPRAGGPTLAALAPAALRLRRDPRARVHPLGGEQARATARRLAALTGRRLED